MLDHWHQTGLYWVPGACGSTTLEHVRKGTSRCETASRGAWRVLPGANVTAARQNCVALCQQCQRCRYLSENVLNCWWYHDCDMTRLSSAAKAYTSARVSTQAPALVIAGGSSTVEQRQRQARQGVPLEHGKFGAAATRLVARKPVTLRYTARNQPAFTTAATKAAIASRNRSAKAPVPDVPTSYKCRDREPRPRLGMVSDFPVLWTWDPLEQREWSAAVAVHRARRAEHQAGHHAEHHEGHQAGHHAEYHAGHQARHHEPHHEPHRPHRSVERSETSGSSSGGRGSDRGSSSLGRGSSPSGSSSSGSSPSGSSPLDSSPSGSSPCFRVGGKCGPGLPASEEKALPTASSERLWGDERGHERQLPKVSSMTAENHAGRASRADVAAAASVDAGVAGRKLAVHTRADEPPEAPKQWPTADELPAVPKRWPREDVCDESAEYRAHCNTTHAELRRPRRDSNP